MGSETPDGLKGAVRLSPEFLSGSTKPGLEKIRTRLLDLTNRNRLLNFKHTSASSLRVVGTHPDVVFRRLMEGEKLTFMAVPEPDDYQGPKPSALDHAKALDWPTSFDLEDVADDEDVAVLPVLHYVEQLETFSRKIGSAAKTAIEESGANMLYLTLGFVEWYESDDSHDPRFAPLLTVPVSLERNAGRGAGFECTIEHSGDDLATNLSLVERMRRDFGIEMPGIDNDDTPEQYFARFQAILALKRRWRIRRWITLTLLSFGKLLMYRDLDPNTWPAITVHPLVKDLFEGRKSEPGAPGEEFDIDAPELRHEIPPLILDADSSQHSALIHALRGQNLVIEGPPGTGKSQTITNLIGAALAKGKTVLFVAEKLAALQVVRKRLDDAGLGAFCLELHSHKTKKHALLNDLAARIKAQGSFREPKDLEHTLTLLEEKKQFLTRYAGEINHRIQPYDATVFEILWARDRYRRELPFTRELAGNVPSALTFTRAQYAQQESFLSVYAQHLTAALRVSPLDKHPWAWLDKALSFDEEERVLQLLADVQETIARISEYVSALGGEPRIALGDCLGDLEVATTLLTSLPGKVPSPDHRLLTACADDELFAELRKFVKDVRRALTALDTVQRFTVDANTFVTACSLKALTDAFETLNHLGLAEHVTAELRTLLSEAKSALRMLLDARGSLTSLMSFTGCEVDFDTPCIESLLGCLRLLEDAPLDILHIRSAPLERDGVGRILHDAVEESDKVSSLHCELDSILDLPAAHSDDPAELIEHAKVLENASILQWLFGTRTRNARRAHARLAKSRTKAPRRQAARDLRRLADYLQSRERFEKATLYQSTFGPHFKGAETNWSDLRLIVGWYEQVFAALPEHDHRTQPLRELLLRGRTERLRALKGALDSKKSERGALADVPRLIRAISETFPCAVSPSRPLANVLESQQASIAALETVIETVSTAGYREDVPLSRVPELITAAALYRDVGASIAAQERVRRLLGDAFNGSRTNVQPLADAVSFAGTLRESRLPAEAVSWLLSGDQGQRLNQVRSWLSEAASSLGTLHCTIEEIAAVTESKTWSSAGMAASLDWYREVATIALGARGELPQWVHFLRVRHQSLQEGLSKLTALADARQMEAKHLVPAFRFLFYDSLARGIFAERPALSSFTGLTVAEIRKQFAELDKDAIALYRQRGAAIIDRRLVPFGSQVGPVGSWTELALIIHEINKQRRHIPIRQLMRRSGRALQALKPCFMMGPLSVAQYLAPGDLSFDLIVMDEASQLKPEDAVGAISRGGQMVIVGDPMQLPPTTFFQRAALDAETEEDEQSRTVAEEGESILDVASTLYQPVRRLRWHYRSRHQSLIAFSNKEFYHGDLVIFPSAYRERSDLGVKYHSVNGGVFENGRNAPEAAVVVEAVLDHMERRPEESLGVVTLNFEQGELIEELLDQRLRVEPFAIAYQEKMNGGSEPFFIKNLENVQGDERDVMFISATYGPDARGNQYQRFGPINGPNGHRRLNVLFTRAKKRTEVFSSLDPHKIQVGPGSARGLRALKEYLIFARTGVLESPDDGTEQPGNDFERSVGAMLKEKGFEVTPQVGVAGFFIDLAVKHPTKPGSYVLGVECDGATYHSGRSARDRDRLREEILVNLGWKIHRVWSTDWFKSRAAESERLLKRLGEILTADPDYQRERTRQGRTEALRHTLLGLRDEIHREFSDSPQDRCLLRDEVLEELMFRRPRSREDWFRLISEPLRAQTESRQASRYLPRILEAIAEAALDR